jgi:8-oxo-dGTP pyrophosphatase MutT (NUDIX family)
VRAAGGVVWRHRDGGDVEVLLVHRPRYRDWTFPKGKVEEGERDEQAAVREVEEETGLRCELGPELPSTHYTDLKLRDKTVRYWAMEATGQGEAGSEVDEVQWIPIRHAGEQLSHRRDRDLLQAFQTR